MGLCSGARASVCTWLTLRVSIMVLYAALIFTLARQKAQRAEIDRTSFASSITIFSIVSPILRGWLFGRIKSLRAATIRLVLRQNKLMSLPLSFYRRSFARRVIWLSECGKRLTATCRRTRCLVAHTRLRFQG